MAPSWKFSGTVHEVRFGVRRHRVFRMHWSSPRAVLAEAHLGWAYDMYADRAAARDLIGAWCLAARSAHTLVWLPMHNHRPPHGLTVDRFAPPLDIVLARSDVQFPAHEWKRVRSALGSGRRATARVPQHEFAAYEDIDRQATTFRESRDHLRFNQAARTLLITGTRTAFDLVGSRLTALDAEAPGYVAKHPRHHYCVEFGEGWYVRHKRRLGPGGLHVEYSPRWDVT